jgi:predicted Fe-Mo cluster-binding NifX family protein
MRIAFAAENNAGLESPVSAHFGHAPYFILVDAEDNAVRSVSSVANPFCGTHGCGQVGGFVASQAAQVLLVGGMGQRAVQAFEAYGIEAVTGAAGTVREALEQYLNGRLRGVVPCLEEGHREGCQH